MKFSIIPLISLVALTSALPAIPSENQVEARSEVHLEKRGWIGTPTCGLVSGDQTQARIAKPAIDTFRNLHGGGAYNINVGARSCKVVMCYTGNPLAAGIHVCNDANQALNVWSSEVADAANAILQKCKNGETGWFKGQFFNTGNYNVILKACT